MVMNNNNTETTIMLVDSIEANYMMATFMMSHKSLLEIDAYQAIRATCDEINGIQKKSKYDDIHPVQVCIGHNDRESRRVGTFLHAGDSIDLIDALSENAYYYANREDSLEYRSSVSIVFEGYGIPLDGVYQFNSKELFRGLAGDYVNKTHAPTQEQKDSLVKSYNDFVAGVL